MEDMPKRRPGRPKKEAVPPLRGNEVEAGTTDKGRFFADQYENSQKKLKAANEEIHSLKEEIYQLKKTARETSAAQSTASEDQQTIAQLKIEGTKEYKELQASAEDLRRRMDNFQKKYKDEKEENARLNATLDQVESERDAHARQVEQLNVTIEKLQSDYDVLAQEAAELTTLKETLSNREHALNLRRETEEKLASLLEENEEKLKQAALDKSYLEKTVELARERIKELESIEDSHYSEPIVTFTAKPVFDQTDLIKGLCRFIAYNTEQGDEQHEKIAFEKIGDPTLRQAE